MCMCARGYVCTGASVCVQENIYTCAYTSYEVSQDFYVGHQRQLKRITVLGILRPNYIWYKKIIAQLYQQSLQKSTSPIIVFFLIFFLIFFYFLIGTPTFRLDS